MALVAVAAARIGAIKSLEQLRGVCSHMGAMVLPGAASVAGVRGAFDEEGNCTDEGVEDALRGIARAPRVHRELRLPEVHARSHRTWRR